MSRTVVARLEPMFVTRIVKLARPPALTISWSATLSTARSGGLSVPVSVEWLLSSLPSPPPATTAVFTSGSSSVAFRLTSAVNSIAG